MIIYDLDFVDDTKIESLTGAGKGNAGTTIMGGGIESAGVFKTVEGLDSFIDLDSDLNSLLESLDIELAPV